MKTDLDLQLALAKMLPEKIRISERHGPVWIKENAKVEETEWLHICWLIEQELIKSQDSGYAYDMALQKEVGAWDSGMPNFLRCWHASWQQRAAALIATKGE